MTDLIFLESKSLSEVQLRKVAIIDNEIPTEFDPEYKPTASDLDERLKLYKDLSDADFFKVALSNDEVVGFHLIKSKEKAGKRYGDIFTLWVHPTKRKKGIAKQLKQMGIAWAKTQKLTYLQTASHSNNSRMIDVNLRSGFKPYSVILRLEL